MTEVLMDLRRRVVELEKGARALDTLVSGAIKNLQAQVNELVQRSDARERQASALLDTLGDQAQAHQDLQRQVEGGRTSEVQALRNEVLERISALEAKVEAAPGADAPADKPIPRPDKPEPPEPPPHVYQDKADAARQASRSAPADDRDHDRERWDDEQGRWVTPPADEHAKADADQAPIETANEDPVTRATAQVATSFDLAKMVLDEALAGQLTKARYDAAVNDMARTKKYLIRVLAEREEAAQKQKRHNANLQAALETARERRDAAQHAARNIKARRQAEGGPFRAVRPPVTRIDEKARYRRPVGLRAGGWRRDTRRYRWTLTATE